MDGFEEATNLSRNALKIVKMILLTFVMSHITACFWGYIANMHLVELEEGEELGSGDIETWFDQYGMRNKDVGTQVCRDFLFSCSKA